MRSRQWLSPPASGPTFAKYPKRFLTLNFLGPGLAIPILGYLAFYFAVPLSFYPKLAGTWHMAHVRADLHGRIIM